MPLLYLSAPVSRLSWGGGCIDPDDRVRGRLGGEGVKVHSTGLSRFFGRRSMAALQSATTSSYFPSRSRVFARFVKKAALLGSAAIARVYQLSASANWPALKQL